MLGQAQTVGVCNTGYCYVRIRPDQVTARAQRTRALSDAKLASSHE